MAERGDERLDERIAELIMKRRTDASRRSELKQQKRKLFHVRIIVRLTASRFRRVLLSRRGFESQKWKPGDMSSRPARILENVISINIGRLTENVGLRQDSDLCDSEYWQYAISNPVM